MLDLAPRHVTPADWAREVSAALAADSRPTRRGRSRSYEFVLEAARQPALRDEVARWEAAQLRLAEAGLRAAGSDDPETDAHVVVATITGLMLAQLDDARSPTSSARSSAPRSSVCSHAWRRSDANASGSARIRLPPWAPCPPTCKMSAIYALMLHQSVRIAELAAGSTASSRIAQLSDLGLGRRRFSTGCELAGCIACIAASTRSAIGVLIGDGRWMAAVLACGPDALLSHRCAAALWPACLRRAADRRDRHRPRKRGRASSSIGSAASRR